MQIAIPTPSPSIPTLPAPRQAARFLASAAVVALAFIIAAWIAGTTPFDGARGDPYSPKAVQRALPFDAPLPYDVTIVEAGRGDRLPYHMQLHSSLPPAAIAAQVGDHLANSPKWHATQSTPIEGEFATTFARTGADGFMTHFAAISVTATGTGSLVTFDFTPVPTTLAPD
ncbi:MAG: hypothetical protein WEC75_10320 [Dehalococcoidia bacterium]